MTRRELRRLRKLVWRETKRKAFEKNHWTFIGKIKKIWSVLKVMNYENKIYKELMKNAKK